MLQQQERVYTVEGMSCEHCRQAVIKEVADVAGVADVEVDLEQKLVTVRGDGFADAAIRDAVDEAGYDVVGLPDLDARADEDVVRIRVKERGPLQVKGPAIFLDADGEQYEVTRKTIFLCRCGGSSTKPFCDGTHNRIEFPGGGTISAADLKRMHGG
jgi:copper chaperone CopZ/CDGSH-type Zn-finger protein